MPCPGNELLRGEGAKGCCPICHMAESAIGGALGKRAGPIGGEKPGPAGERVLVCKVSR